MNKDFANITGYIEKKENEEKFKYVVYEENTKNIIKESDYIYNSRSDVENEVRKIFPDLQKKSLMSR